MTITITGTNDAPTISDVANIPFTEAANASAQDLSASGTVSFNDIDTNDVVDISTALTTGAVWSGGTIDAGLKALLEAGFSASVTDAAAPGTTPWAYTVNDANLDFLKAGETITLTYTLTATDTASATATDTVTITITGTNDAPVVQNIKVWMSSDADQQTLTTTQYPDGYPIQIFMPTDVDGDSLTITVSNTVAGVFYNNGSAYVALTAGTTLLNGTVNFLDDLVYRPTAPSDVDTPNLQLQLSVSDGMGGVVPLNVNIAELSGVRQPDNTSVIGGGNSPLTSGNDLTANLSPLTSSFINGIAANNYASATIKVYTDFQESPFVTPIPLSERDPGLLFTSTSPGTQREQEVQVELRIGTNRFVIVEDDLTAATYEQSWFYDSATGLMAATVSYNNIFLLNASGVATTTSLAAFLQTNSPVVGDTWTVSYFDNDGGNYQARSVKFDFFSNDPGDPGITVIGTVLVDQAYGTSGSDSLSGNGGNDWLEGRGGSDVLNGGLGDDTLIGGTGADVFKWSLDDQGTSATPGVDHITDFDVSVNGPTGSPGPSTGDVLDLRDLLVEESASNLSQYLKFELVGGKLALAVDHNGVVDNTGAFTSTQKIVLDNYSGTDLQVAKDAFGSVLGLSGGNYTDATIISRMIADGHLKTDV